MGVLKVQGKGHVSVEPDLVRLSFNVETQARDYEECINRLNARVDDLRAGMTSSGFQKTELKTSSFDVSVDTKYKDGLHVFVGYRASHSLHIEFPLDKELLNKVLGHVARSHSGAQVSIYFSVKDRDALRKKVLTQAVQAARENAATLAAAAGLKLGRLVQLDYGWAEVRVYDQRASMLAEQALVTEACGPDIEPEDVRAEDNVTLVFEIAE